MYLVTCKYQHFCFPLPHTSYQKTFLSPPRACVSKYLLALCVCMYVLFGRHRKIRGPVYILYISGLFAIECLCIIMKMLGLLYL